MTGLKIHLPSYPRGVHHIHETFTAEEFNLDPQVFASLIEVHVKLDRHDPYLEFNYDLQTKITAQCDRCLADFDWTLAASSPMLYVMGRRPPGEEVDDPGIDYLPAGTADVDLTGEIRDLMILTLPRKSLCREDCRGLCPGCGADLNVQECSCGLSR